MKWNQKSDSKKDIWTAYSGPYRLDIWSYRNELIAYFEVFEKGKRIASGSGESATHYMKSLSEKYKKLRLKNIYYADIEEGKVKYVKIQINHISDSPGKYPAWIGVIMDDLDIAPVQGDPWDRQNASTFLHKKYALSENEALKNLIQMHSERIKELSDELSIAIQEMKSGNGWQKC